ncbi:MAG: 4-hydroxy-tetrahydrodipicolinate synthase [Rhodospirillaceae bacterium]|jgi:4-hydroxy-tetrahydrodipicolinate synthase|nr:4-hydroxy-tetrahydrodipicolinate synthase [Rhodospirillaceae bacterium]|tara:strand:+ start:1124 stop:2050 length:927 start_codon:yes stop_codon:yes gene_type:complete
MMRLPKNFLKGSIPPLITPFRNGKVDYDAYAGLVEFQVKNGSHGILVTGTTSEPSTLTTDERNRCVDVAVEAVNRKIPIVAATGSQSHAETVLLSEHAERAGADALLVVTPYYIRPPQRGLVAYYRDIGKRTNLPWMIYHIPGRAAISVTLDTLDQINKACPNFVGMKHAVDDLGFVSKCLDHFGKDFRIFVGLEDLSYPMMTVGACGLMNAVGNLMPKKLARMCELVWKGNMKAAQKIHYELFEINQAVFYDTNPIPMKYMMKKLGIMPKNEHRLPMMPAPKDLEKRLDGVLKRAGLIKPRLRRKSS